MGWRRRRPRHNPKASMAYRSSCSFPHDPRPLVFVPGSGCTTFTSGRSTTPRQQFGLFTCVISPSARTSAGLRLAGDQGVVGGHGYHTMFFLAAWRPSPRPHQAARLDGPRVPALAQHHRAPPAADHPRSGRDRFGSAWRSDEYCQGRLQRERPTTLDVYMWETASVTGDWRQATRRDRLDGALAMWSCDRHVLRSARGTEEASECPPHQRPSRRFRWAGRRDPPARRKVQGWSMTSTPC